MKISKIYYFFSILLVKSLLTLYIYEGAEANKNIDDLIRSSLSLEYDESGPHPTQGGDDPLDLDLLRSVLYNVLDDDDDDDDSEDYGDDDYDGDDYEGDDDGDSGPKDSQQESKDSSPTQMLHSSTVEGASAPIIQGSDEDFQIIYSLKLENNPFPIAKQLMNILKLTLRKFGNNNENRHKVCDFIRSKLEQKNPKGDPLLVEKIRLLYNCFVYELNIRNLPTSSGLFKCITIRDKFVLEENIFWDEVIAKCRSVIYKLIPDGKSEQYRREDKWRAWLRILAGYWVKSFLEHMIWMNISHGYCDEGFYKSYLFQKGTEFIHLKDEYVRRMKKYLSYCRVYR